jgi:ABC-type Zn2+ transport system substrate-binding protein/surface adhesin
MTSKPDLTDFALQQLKVIQQEIKAIESRLDDLKEKKKEWLAHLVDDPYFVKNKNFNYEDYGIQVGVTHPTIKDDKWHANERKKIVQKFLKNRESWDDYRNHGVNESKSQARPYVRLIKE